jgi:TPR repeat protein
MSQVHLGFFYLNGYGCDKDEDKGAELIEEVSDLDESALVFLGGLYHTAGPEYQNFLNALKYYQKVPEGIQKSFALRGIGLLYEHGDGVEQNYEESLAFYQKAADGKNKGAYYSIALLYFYGNGVDKDHVTSFVWFTKIIEQKVKYAVRHTCVLNENNAEDEVESKKTKTYTIEQEPFLYGEAHWYLGTMLENGQGTAIDREMANKHFKMATSYGCVRAQ